MLLLPEYSLSTLNVIHHMDALSLLRGLRSGSVDAIITDPPYAEIDRDYGRLTERQWRDLMYPLVIEAKRVLTPQGSAVFILQPNMEKLGRMRMWLWEFMLFCAREWNVIQDVYWWNIAAMPGIQNDLCRPSVKTCVWVGSPDAYRNRKEVLWDANWDALATKKQDDARINYPSGTSTNYKVIVETTRNNGGSTPFNLLPIANTNSSSSAGSTGHGAGTPDSLIEWWMRYITKPFDLVVDPFMGSGTTALVARSMNRYYIGSEKDSGYVATAQARLAMTDPFQHKPLSNGLTQKSLFAMME